jgi:hypothetical protein
MVFAFTARTGSALRVCAELGPTSPLDGSRSGVLSAAQSERMVQAELQRMAGAVGSSMRLRSNKL